ncbi:hypothetical protein D9M71_378970 [compost metagenome]
MRRGEAAGGGQHVGLHRAAGALEGEVGEVLRCAEAAGDHQGVEVGGLQFAHVADLAAGNARRLDQHVAALGAFRPGQVVDHMVLGDVRSEALHLRAALAQAQQGDHAFVDLGTVIDAAAGQDHGNLLAHGGHSLVVLQARAGASGAGGRGIFSILAASGALRPCISGRGGYRRAMVGL